MNHTANLTNGAIGIGGAILAGLTHAQDQAAWIGGMLVILVTLINGLWMIYDKIIVNLKKSKDETTKD